ncbi:DEAD/DEAH box helicase family protein [Parasphingorhabdus sp.]|uniref:DEAD/DEAH box helicase family protein n=1 Tax=Parasphingorhabdus sp. TaxID=2709688 RepID=UPI003A948FC3
MTQEFGRRTIEQTPIPNHIADNLRYEIRPYQREAFQRFILFEREAFEGKPTNPAHLLFNMATGSGKTLIMAGLILDLFERGHRNFLFFVNSTNIIEKTKDNFLNPHASKYLFTDEVVVNGKTVKVKEVSNFDEADSENINIKFTTIQQLHLDLNNAKENSITFEDFENRKVVLIADEAHHLSSGTKSEGDLFGSWEGTVLNILKTSYDNILLEFTATLDYEAQEIAQKYQDKVLYRYDLAQFRSDLYSKEINLIRSQYGETERIIQALILNLYRQEMASAHNINLKPIILFKAKRTIKESEENKTNFHKLIDNLSASDIDKLRVSSKVNIVGKAFNFFDSIELNADEIVARIRSHFKEENCLSANNDSEAELNQIRLNTLEDEHNPIRAIFAVQKLNEGWDVLNLFDIVRLYEGQNTGGKTQGIGKTTLSEAQLIGRGARYCPFVVDSSQDRYKRKYDNDITNDLKVLEELYYHTKEDNRYIAELKRALVQTGLYEDEDNLVTRELKLTSQFKKTKFFKTGKVVFNDRIEKSYDNVKSFKDMGVTKSNFTHALSSGSGAMTGAFESVDLQVNGGTAAIDVRVSDIPAHVIRYALSQNPFYHFDNLSRYFPNARSISNLIASNDYLGQLAITVKGSKDRTANVGHRDYLRMMQELLAAIEVEVKSNLTDYESSEYRHDHVRNVFGDKLIRVQKDSERANGQEGLVNGKSWYAYNANYGTDEEKAFVEMFDRRFKALQQTFKDIYLIRNERALKIFDPAGRAFEPDFLLFCKQLAGEELTYQVFIEPKGKHLAAHDKWKEDFLTGMRESKETLAIDGDQYRITGVPFYHYENENEFSKALEGVLEVE